MINKTNLMKLGRYLWQNIKGSQFDMSMYRLDENWIDCNFYSFEDCGTIGCALGWSPFVKGLEPIEDDFYVSGGKLMFERYCARIFGINFTENPKLEFIFGGNWSGYDDSVQGACQRIIAVCEKQHIEEFKKIWFYTENTALATYKTINPSDYFGERLGGSK